MFSLKHVNISATALQLHDNYKPLFQVRDAAFASIVFSLEQRAFHVGALWRTCRCRAGCFVIVSSRAWYVRTRSMDSIDFCFNEPIPFTALVAV